MKKIILISITAVLLIACLGFYINHRMKVSERNEKFSEVMGKEQGLTELLLKIPNASMSYGDVFKWCEKATEQNNEMFLTISSYHLEDNLTDSVKEYIAISNDLVSNLKFCYKDLMEGNDLTEGTISDYLLYWRYSSYFSEYYRERSFEKILRFIEKYKEHRLKFVENYKILLHKEVTLSIMMNNSGIKFTSLYSKYKNINLTEMEPLAKTDSNYNKYYNIGLPYITDVARYYNLDKWSAQSDTQSSSVFKKYKDNLTQFSAEDLQNEIHRRTANITSIKANNNGNVQFVYTIGDKDGIIIYKDKTVYMNKDKETGEYVFTIPQ